MKLLSSSPGTGLSNPGRRVAVYGVLTGGAILGKKTEETEAREQSSRLQVRTTPKQTHLGPIGE